MPRKPRKSKEEKIVEGFFPTNITNSKRTVEKIQKQPLEVELANIKLSKGRKQKKKRQ